jgi:hypothetical protein
MLPSGWTSVTVGSNKPRYIVIELFYAGPEYDDVLSYESHFFTIFFTGLQEKLTIPKWVGNEQKIAGSSGKKRNEL